MNIILKAITPNAEDVIEQAGRSCYQSWHNYCPPASAEKFIKNLIKRGHHSVLEHAQATFYITGGSRAFTHQLVRHRLLAISQESQRSVNYVNYDHNKKNEFEYVIPPSIDEAGLTKEFKQVAALVYNLYKKAVKRGVAPGDARYILPNATTSGIVISGNFRELRHIFCMRCVSAAQWEIREVALQMLKIMKANTPSCFFDFEINEEKRIATHKYFT